MIVLKEQQVYHLLIILVLTVLLIIILIPLIINEYRTFKSNQKMPYAFFECKTAKGSILGDYLKTEVHFRRICNQIGLLLFLETLDENLKEMDIDIVETIQHLRTNKKEGGMIVEDADKDSSSNL